MLLSISAGSGLPEPPPTHTRHMVHVTFPLLKKKLSKHCYDLLGMHVSTWCAEKLSHFSTQRMDFEYIWLYTAYTVFTIDGA